MLFASRTGRVMLSSLVRPLPKSQLPARTFTTTRSLTSCFNPQIFPRPQSNVTTLSVLIPSRTFARSSFRKNDVPEKEKQEENKSNSSFLTSWTGNAVTQPKQEQKIMETLDAGAVKHLRQVYSSSAVMMGAAGATSMASVMLLPSIPFLGFAGLIGMLPAMYIYMTPNTPETLQKRKVALWATAGFFGLGLTPLLGAVISTSPMLLPTALGLTGGLFAALTGLSLVLPSSTVLSWTGPLAAGALTIFGAVILGVVLPASWPIVPYLHSISLYGGLALFSVFTIFDLHRIVEDYRMGNEDVVRHTLDMFINLWGIFHRLLFILFNRD